MTYITQVRNEQATSLQVTNGVSIAEAQVFSTCFRPKPNDCLVINAQTEVTNNLGFIVGIGYVIRAWDYYAGLDGSSTCVGSFNVIPPVMTNVTPDMHHLVVKDTALDQVAFQGNTNVRCYTLVLWAVSSHGTGSIIIEPSYGFLQVMVP